MKKVKSFLTQNVSKKTALKVLTILLVLLVPAFAMATTPTLTIPDVPTDHMFDAAGKAFAILGVAVGIGFAIKFFKKA